jgi:three-Cys-motif partner protein
MAQSSDHFKGFEPHTRLKHAILRAYVERWSRILLARSGSSRQRVRIVDACAGEGQDEQGNPGSPLIAIREAEKARGQMTQHRAADVDVQIVAIEKDSARFKHLADMVGAFGGRHVAHQGTLANYISALEADFSSTPTLFFIDPFGMEPLQAEVVRRALSGPKNEVLLLFADQAGLRHLGAADAIEQPDEQELDLFGTHSLPLAPVPISKGLQDTGEAAVRILNAAFGDDRWRAVSELPRSMRRQALVDLYADLLRSMGAGYVLALPIIGSQTQLKYHLMFATKSGKGYEVMKDSIERALDKDLLDHRSAQLMRMGVAAPTPAIEQVIRKRFAGRRVPWTGNGASDSIRAFALQETPAMRHQMEDLKQRLKPLRVRGEQALVYDFPPAS